MTHLCPVYLLYSTLPSSTARLLYQYPIYALVSHTCSFLYLKLLLPAVAAIPVGHITETSLTAHSLFLLCPYIAYNSKLVINVVRLVEPSYKLDHCFRLRMVAMINYPFPPNCDERSRSDRKRKSIYMFF